MNFPGRVRVEVAHLLAPSRELTICKYPNIFVDCCQEDNSHDILPMPKFHFFNSMYTGPLFIASDHAGYQLKKRLLRYLQNELHVEVEDLGPTAHDPDDDFPDYIFPAASKAVAVNGRAIMIWGPGIGACITANKVKGMYAALAYNIESAELSRKDNNANGLCLAGRVLTEDHAMAMVKKWLETEFAGGRHERRLKKIEKLAESENF